MIIFPKKTKWAQVSAGIKFLNMEKFIRKRDWFLSGCDLAVKNLNFKSVVLKGCGKKGQPYWLGSDRGLVEIPDGRLNEKNFHEKILPQRAQGTQRRFLG